MTSLEKIDALGECLDKLTDANGRAKCGLIWAMNDLLDELRADILIMEEQINQNGEEMEDLDNGNRETDCGESS